MEDFLRQIREARRDYEGPELDDKQVPSDPMVLFGAWLEIANEKEKPEPLAMTLSTGQAGSRISARVVLLRGLDHDGFRFYTNYLSRKGNEIENNPLAALTFFWPVMSRQVRIEGKLEKVPAKESDEYFASRPRGSQIGAWASVQSEAVASRAVLDREYSRVEKLYDGKDIPRPPHWGGYILTPDRIEFWQGQLNRLHDRVLYNLQGGKWEILRLFP